MRLLTVLALTAIPTLAAGCGGPPTGMAADLPGSSWTLERIVQDDGTVVRGDGDQVTFGPDGSLAVASCNQCSGRYSVREDVLTVSAPLACTKRACAPGAVELERYLGETATLRRDGAYLVIEPVDGGGQQILLVPAGEG